MTSSLGQWGRGEYCRIAVILLMLSGVMRVLAQWQRGAFVASARAEKRRGKKRRGKERRVRNVRSLRGRQKERKGVKRRMEKGKRERIINE